MRIGGIAGIALQDGECDGRPCLLMLVLSYDSTLYFLHVHPSVSTTVATEACTAAPLDLRSEHMATTAMSSVRGYIGIAGSKADGSGPAVSLWNVSKVGHCMKIASYPSTPKPPRWFPWHRIRNAVIHSIALFTSGTADHLATQAIAADTAGNVIVLLGNGQHFSCTSADLSPHACTHCTVCQVAWWSVDTAVIARECGAITITRIPPAPDAWRNLLGSSPEKFAPLPAIECVSLGSCCILESAVETPTPEKITLRLATLCSTTPEQLFRSRLDQRNYDGALKVAEAYRLDQDLVVKRQWSEADVSHESIENLLNRVKDRNWVRVQCCTRLANSENAMKLLLNFGLKECDLPEMHGLDDAAIAERIALMSEEQLEIARFRVVLLRHLDRLVTFSRLPEFAGYHSQSYAAFRSADIFVLAIERARRGNVPALRILLRIHTTQLECRRGAILDAIPEILDPRLYQELLPRSTSQDMQAGTVTAGRPRDWADAETVIALAPPPSSALSESTAVHSAPMSDEEARQWYMHRIRVIEQRSGQIDLARAMSDIASEHGIDLAEFASTLQILYVAVYVCNNSVLSLSEWEQASPLQQLGLLIQQQDIATSLRHPDIQAFVKAHGGESFLADYAQHLAPTNLHNVIIVLRSQLKSPTLLCRTVLACAYASPLVDDWNLLWTLYELLPEEIDDASLAAAADLLKEHIEAATALASRKLPRPLKFFTDVRDKASDEHLMLSLAQRAVRNATTDVHWTAARRDLKQLAMALRVPVSAADRVYAASLLRAEKLQLAKGVLGDIEDKQLVGDLVADAASTFVDGAANAQDPTVSTAEKCLALASRKHAAIAAELNFIKAIKLLYDVGLRLPPAKLRLNIEQCLCDFLASKPQVAHNVLMICELMNLSAEICSHVRAVAASAALHSKMFELAVGLCQTATTTGALAEREVLDVARSLATEESLSSGDRQQMVQLALRQCAPEHMLELLNVFRQAAPPAVYVPSWSASAWNEALCTVVSDAFEDEDVQLAAAAVLSLCDCTSEEERLLRIVHEAPSTSVAAEIIAASIAMDVVLRTRHSVSYLLVPSSITASALKLPEAPGLIRTLRDIQRDADVATQMLAYAVPNTNLRELTFDVDARLDAIRWLAQSHSEVCFKFALHLSTVYYVTNWELTVLQLQTVLCDATFMDIEARSELLKSALLAHASETAEVITKFANENAITTVKQMYHAQLLLRDCAKATGNDQQERQHQKLAKLYHALNDAAPLLDPSLVHQQPIVALCAVVNAANVVKLAEAFAAAPVTTVRREHVCAALLLTHSDLKWTDKLPADASNAVGLLLDEESVPFADRLNIVARLSTHAHAAKWTTVAGVDRVLMIMRALQVIGMADADITAHVKEATDVDNVCQVLVRLCVDKRFSPAVAYRAALSFGSENIAVALLADIVQSVLLEQPALVHELKVAVMDAPLATSAVLDAVRHVARHPQASVATRLTALQWLKELGDARSADDNKQLAGLRLSELLQTPSDVDLFNVDTLQTVCRERLAQGVEPRVLVDALTLWDQTMKDTMDSAEQRISPAHSVWISVLLALLAAGRSVEVVARITKQQDICILSEKEADELYNAMDVTEARMVVALHLPFVALRLRAGRDCSALPKLSRSLREKIFRMGLLVVLYEGPHYAKAASELLGTHHTKVALSNISALARSGHALAAGSLAMSAMRTHPLLRSVRNAVDVSSKLQ
eukprot:TRINITY_DN7714_c0_g2_i1.p1 TRINITY_DN7714_c0_g2~~TRINITY_DN7714_c0_g2_i1.p1  ORF type:complete len:1719 (+),score=454.00 TRINITY_DN7714_c0_g2_i1:2534-7690(+)